MALGYKTGGRKKGSPNVTSAEVRAYCQQILRRIKVDKLIRELYLDAEGEHKQLTEVSSRVLIKLLEYGWGAPKQELEVTVNLRDAVSAARARVLDAQVVEVRQLEAGSGTNAESTEAQE